LFCTDKNRCTPVWSLFVPNVTPVRQRELVTAALKHIAARDLTNTVVEVKYARSRIECSEYALPKTDE